MAAGDPMPKWLVRLGYAAFALFAFLISLYVTFPYDAVRQRLQNEASAAGFVVRIGSVGPGLLGITARRLELARAAKPDAEGTPAPLLIDSLAFRPSLFPAGIALDARAFGGEVTGAVGGLGDLAINLNLEDLDPSQGNLREATGLDLEGRVSGRLRLDIPRVAPSPTSKIKEPALSQANGELRLDARGFTLKGGTLEIPLYGQMTPMDMPRIVLGELDGRIVIEKGLARIETFKTTSEDVELLAEGTLKLNNNVGYSESDILLKVKAAPEFVKRLGLIGSGLSILPSDRADPNFRVARMSGFLARPNFAPARQ